MIVRINQFDAEHSARFSGWSESHCPDPEEFIWPIGTHAFELLILDRDEQGRPLPLAFRQNQMRQLIAEVVAAMQNPAEHLAVRLDGPWVESELPAATRHLNENHHPSRFAISPIRKLDPHATPIGSIRLQRTTSTLAKLCQDSSLGLDRDVRLRVLALPEKLINTFLDIDGIHDRRWEPLLAQAGFVLTTVRSLQSLHVITRRFDTETARQRLMHRLLEPNHQGMPMMASRV